MKSILYAEDDEATRAVVTSFLTADGYTVEAFPTADELLEAFGRREPDLVLLDIVLSGTDGLEALARIRAVSTVPVMLLTARGDDIDVCSGLALGGDDYLAKPFSPLVLVNRVRALMRRVDYDAASRGPAPAQDDLVCGNTKLDRRRHTVYVGERPLPTTPTELRLITFFMEHTDEALSRQASRGCVAAPRRRREPDAGRDLPPHARQVSESRGGRLHPDRPRLRLPADGARVRWGP